jgi:ribosomal protein S20
MNRSRKTWFAVFATLAVAVAMLVGAAAVATSQVALAQAPSPTPANPSSGSTTASTTVQKYWDFFWNAFSQQVSVDITKLKSGFVLAVDATVDQAVKDGIISQAAGDNIKTRVGNLVTQGPAASGNFPFSLGRGFGFKGGRGGAFGIQINLGPAEFAKALNMTNQALTNELQAGKSINDVAKEHNIDPATVKASVLADVKTQLDTAVKSGNLTQAQADQIYSNVSGKVDTLMSAAGAKGPSGKWLPNNPNNPNNNGSSGGSRFRGGGNSGNGL